MTEETWCGISCCSYIRTKISSDKTKIHPDIWCECGRNNCAKGFAAKDCVKSAKVGCRFFQFCSESCYYAWLYKNQSSFM